MSTLEVILVKNMTKKASDSMKKGKDRCYTHHLNVWKIFRSSFHVKKSFFCKTKFPQFKCKQEFKPIWDKSWSLIGSKFSGGSAPRPPHLTLFFFLIRRPGKVVDLFTPSVRDYLYDSSKFCHLCFPWWDFRKQIWRKSRQGVVTNFCCRNENKWIWLFIDLQGEPVFFKA